MIVGSERWLACAIVAVAGCSQILDLGDFHLGGSDAGGDGGTTTLGDAMAVPGPTCGFSSVFDTCGANATFGTAITIDGSATFDTSSSSLVMGSNAMAVTVAPTFDPDEPSLVVAVLLVSGLTITGTGTLTVTGVNAFGVASTGNIQIDGAIIAPPGAEAAGTRSAADCGGQTGVNGISNSSGAYAPGGGGGAFGGSGGAGGSGGGKAGSTGGMALMAPPTFPIGGCPGGAGGPAESNPIHQAAFGGGAIYLASKTQIFVTNSISAGGEGGMPGISTLGSLNGDGGGGGASGGLIWLEATMIVVEGTLVANGGGGGQGADFNNSADTSAAAGSDGDTFAAAAGGAGSGDGGAGGAGGAGTSPGGATGQSNKSGGGGGGGAGFIVLTTATGGLQTFGAKISPAPNVFVELP